MSEELRSKLENAIDKCLETRFSFEIPEFGAGPVELHSALVNVQESLSDIERHLSQAIRAKAACDRRQAHVKLVWQEAFDRALIKKKAGFSGDFVTGKEKIADANLAAFEEARTLRQLEELKSFADEAVEIIRLHYYGLDKVRQDVRKRLDLSQTDYYA